MNFRISNSRQNFLWLGRYIVAFILRMLSIAYKDLVEERVLTRFWSRNQPQVIAPHRLFGNFHLS
jgi:hypothetical protein